MADLEALWADVADDDAVDVRAAGGRAVCEGCARPASACLCDRLPARPFETRGALVVLTHPNESKRALNTGWILPRCMRRCEIVRGRYPPQHLQDRMAGMAPDVPMYLLYPSASATNLDEVSVAVDDAAAIVPASTGQGSLGPDDVLAGSAYVCVCIDSTWGQAREMAVPTLEKMPARTRLIQLPLTSTVDGDDDDDGGYRVDAPGLRRFSEGDGGAGSLLTAPAPGAMLTAEAAARAVAMLESTCPGGGGGGGGGASVERWCVGAVRAMAAFQARHDPAMSGGAVKRGGGRRQRLADPSRLEGAAGRAL